MDRAALEAEDEMVAEQTENGRRSLAMFAFSEGDAFTS